VASSAVVGDGPGPRIGANRANGLVDAAVGPGVDRELDVAGHQAVDQQGNRTGAVGAHHEAVADQGCAVAGVVASPVAGRQLGDGGVHHCQLVDAGVGRGVARAQDAGQGLSRVVGEAEHRVEAEAALVVRGRLLLVLGVDLDQGRVDVEDDLFEALQRCPGRGPGLGPSRPRAAQDGLVDLAHRPPDGGGGGHIAEQLGLVPQRGHVGDALATAGQHHRHLGQQPAPVLARRPLARPGHGRRIGRSQAEPIGEIPKKVHAHQGGGLGVALGHHQRLHGACSVHL
jgi:hypothetical protein